MSESLTERLLKNSPQSVLGKLRAYVPSDHVVDAIGKENWKKIVGWTKDDKEFYEEVLNFSSVIGAVVYVRHDSDVPSAFGVVFIDNWYRKIASFHGGGWGNAWTNFDCAKLLIESMESLGLSVRTSVSCKNVQALRFVKGLGMEHYRTVKGQRLFRFNPLK